MTVMTIVTFTPGCKIGGSLRGGRTSLQRCMSMMMVMMMMMMMVVVVKKDSGLIQDEPKMEAGDVIDNVMIAVISQKSSSQVRISTGQ